MTFATPSSAASLDTNAGAKDFVFTFSYESYVDARKRGMMRPPDRLVATLMAVPMCGGCSSQTRTGRGSRTGVAR